MRVLWPTPGLYPANENNNSVVLAITLGNVSFMLTGDAEADVWTQLARQIPQTTCFFKVPHHGSENGMFDAKGDTPWLTGIPKTTILATSCHIRPFKHPDPVVVGKLQQHGFVYRTDEHYHVTIETDGMKVEVTYSHI